MEWVDFWDQMWPHNTTRAHFTGVKVKENRVGARMSELATDILHFRRFWSQGNPSRISSELPSTDRNVTSPGICNVWAVLFINPLNPELNPICYLLALLAHHFLHVSRIRVKSLTLKLLMSYIYIYIYVYDISSLRVNDLTLDNKMDICLLWVSCVVR